MFKYILKYRVLVIHFCFDSHYYELSDVINLKFSDQYIITETIFMVHTYFTVPISAILQDSITIKNQNVRF